MNKETLRMQMLSGVITESEYKAKLNENRTAEELFQMFKDEDLLNDRREYDIEDLMSAYPDLSQEEAKKLEKMLQKDSLNEHYVAGGIVGIGAINQIPSRAKAVYEDAFEHFLSQKYDLKENEETEDAFSSPSDTNPVVQDYLKQLTDMLNNQTDDTFDLKNLKYAVDKFSNMINDEIAKFEVEEGEIKENEETDASQVYEGKLNDLYLKLKDILFPYYTDLTGKERVDMIDDIIKELNSYISILHDEKKAKQPK